MGAGKSTAVNQLKGTKFWEEYGSCVVIIEADALKMHDPVFKMLKAHSQVREKNKGKTKGKQRENKGKTKGKQKKNTGNERQGKL